MRYVVKKTFVKMKNEWKMSGLPAPRSACLWCRLRPALPACGVDGSRWISIEVDGWLAMDGSRWIALDFDGRLSMEVDDAR